MPDSHDLSQLNPTSFEHLVNALALRVLGAGHTGFGPGSDAGRDGYFEGEAPYPSATDRWKGRWFIQSKFHKPHLSKDPQGWLLDQINAELKAFADPEQDRKWPDNWIIATNVDPSGVPMTGTFDKARRIVGRARPKLKSRFHIWGGRKILDLLAGNTDVAVLYGHFLTPGHILSALYNQLQDSRPSVESLIRFLVVRQFEEHKHTKLDQAGSAADERPGIHQLFVDLPFRSRECGIEGLIVNHLVRAAGKTHRIDPKLPDTKEWRAWRRHPLRARVWFIRGGPGQGKSTIGQYFCQLQRASLILQPDGPRVTPTLRTEADEVKKSPVSTSFWPVVPRIPIAIELKDYAEWLGQRAKGRPLGILTYLADRFTAGIQQNVEAGLIKRAIMGHSWFVVFDGLDEVPSDVKDAVALEVRSFLDDTIIECDSDLLAICTSRPQGYSGQFSDIDGPTIELTALSPDQALQCAKPVVQLGRPPAEARRAFETLRAAITSPSVKELMTTPLQSHIMAVVVRDGGKPPERRWQLFANFYQVIKRREANKNFPDQRLAKLLREEERLLKTLHNRLGFLLHSRAETSEGAQTRLERSEFRKLAEQAVGQMVETGLNETVEVLMTATADRLVLVSTPDDGNHLRFDIRPLQEFFAAEFLYESVNADELRKRLEVVAGDAHWREVLHFLLSGLVENDRQTELAVATDVLERLNDGDGDAGSRLLRRRLGRGALAAARLLQDGVLEQDKRNRQQFRNAIEPLMGFASAGDMLPLLGLQQPNSLNWLLSFLFDSLLEKDRSENVGAAILLAHLLPVDDHRVGDVVNYLRSAPMDFLAGVLAGANAPSERHDRVRPVQKWFLSVVISTLSDERWFQLGDCRLESAIRILQAKAVDSIAAAKASGLVDSHIDLLQALLAEGTRKEVVGKKIEYGIASAYCFEHDWTTGTGAFGKWTGEISEEKSIVKGVFKLLYRLFRWSRTRRYHDFRDLLALLTGEVIECITALPRSVSAHLPIDWSLSLERQVESLRRLSEGDFNKLCADHSLPGLRSPRPKQLLQIMGQCSLDQWQNFVRDCPRMGLVLWTDHFWKHSTQDKPALLDDASAADVLIDQVVNFPELLGDAPSVWGRLVQRAPHREPELRLAFLAASRGPVREGYGRWPKEVQPLVMSLPQEAALLPHLLNAQVECLESPWAFAEAKESQGKIPLLAAQFGTTPDQLSALADDTQLEASVRAAAAFLLILQAPAQNELGRRRDTIVLAYHRGIGAWYFNVLSFCLSASSSEQDAEARALLAGLLDRTRPDYYARRALRRLFIQWRETSSAPVQKAGVAGAWLEGSKG